MTMVKEIPYVLLILSGTLLGLWLANLFYDYKIPQYISRKIGHLAGAVAFLMMPFLFHTFWWPLILCAGFTGLLLFARWMRPTTFRGVGGSGRPQAFAEVNFPATGIVLIGVIWGIYHQPWMAVIPLTFMGAGDALTGLIRSQIYGREVKGNWGSLGMIVTCLLLAYFIHPYWLGVVGVAVAVLAEKFTPTTQWIDDNFSIPLASGFVMLALFKGLGLT